MKLSLNDKDNKRVCQLDNDAALLGSYPIEDNMIVHVSFTAVTGVLGCGFTVQILFMFLTDPLKLLNNELKHDIGDPTSSVSQVCSKLILGCYKEKSCQC